MRCSPEWSSLTHVGGLAASGFDSLLILCQVLFPFGSGVPVVEREEEFFLFLGLRAVAVQCFLQIVLAAL